MSENYADTNLEEWLAWTLSRGTPDPNQAAQEHPVVVYLNQIVSRLEQAEQEIDALQVAAASDGWEGFD